MLIVVDGKTFVAFPEDEAALLYKLAQPQLDRCQSDGVRFPDRFLANVEHAATCARSRTVRIPENPSPATLDDDEWLSAKEVATRLQVSKRGTLALLERGRLPGRKRGGRWLVRSEIVDIYMANRQEVS